MRCIQVVVLCIQVRWCCAYSLFNGDKLGVESLNFCRLFEFRLGSCFSPDKQWREKMCSINTITYVALRIISHFDSL